MAVCLAACNASTVPEPADTGGLRSPAGVWDPRQPEASDLAAPRGLVRRRAVFHLHSPWSHDACDGSGYEDGVLDTVCADQLREGLCQARFDLAYLTDHPDYGDAQPFEQLFHERRGDRRIMEGDDLVATEITCPDGHVVRWRPGFEDEVMPVGLRHHIDPDPAVRHDLLNRTDREALDAMTAAGATVLLAHTEGRDLVDLMRLQDDGLHGVEAFNVHAMFAPDIRQEFLGLDPLGWAADLGPFTFAGATAEPDLLFLAVAANQPPSLAAWDALLERGPMMGTAGSDAHQNVLSTLLSDGERVDSYRRTLRWFSTTLLAYGTTPEDDDEALAARRAYVLFEIFGTPEGFDVALHADGEVYEMGADAPPGELRVACPRLHPDSPHDGPDPDIRVSVLKDGEVWQTGCGAWPAERGVYRVEVYQTPHHLTGFLREEASHMVREYPWIYSGAIRVGM